MISMKNMFAVSSVAFAITILSACAPEQTTRVYPQEVTGIAAESHWNNTDWNAQLPEGWHAEPVFGMRDASFRVISESGSEAEVAFSRLPMSGGSLASNVNRWRVQAGLEPWEEEGIVKKLKTISISNHDGYLMEFPAGQEGSPSIYGVIIEEAEQRIFIKFSGPAELVAAELNHWNQFIENLEMKHAH